MLKKLLIIYFLSFGFTYSHRGHFYGGPSVGFSVGGPNIGFGFGIGRHRSYWDDDFIFGPYAGCSSAYCSPRVHLNFVQYGEDEDVDFVGRRRRKRMREIANILARSDRSLSSLERKKERKLNRRNPLDTSADDSKIKKLKSEIAELERELETLQQQETKDHKKSESKEYTAGD